MEEIRGMWEWRSQKLQGVNLGYQNGIDLAEADREAKGWFYINWMYDENVVTLSQISIQMNCY